MADIAKLTRYRQDWLSSMRTLSPDDNTVCIANAGSISEGDSNVDGNTDVDIAADVNTERDADTNTEAITDVDIAANIEVDNAVSAVKLRLQLTFMLRLRRPIM